MKIDNCPLDQLLDIIIENDIGLGNLVGRQDNEIERWPYLQIAIVCFDLLMKDRADNLVAIDALLSCSFQQHVKQRHSICLPFDCDLKHDPAPVVEKADTENT